MAANVSAVSCQGIEEGGGGDSERTSVWKLIKRRDSKMRGYLMRRSRAIGGFGAFVREFWTDLAIEGRFTRGQSLLSFERLLSRYLAFGQTVPVPYSP
jgi:hypothetical protein